MTSEIKIKLNPFSMNSTFVIIKHLKTNTGITVPVIILDSQGEVLEFETQEEAENMRSIFQKNSDSGYTFSLREIKGHSSIFPLNS